MAENSEDVKGLIVPVVLKADEKSPGIALHKLTKEFLKELKDGYMDVPIKLDFGKANKAEFNDKLEKVQEDFAAKWKAMAKKDFFAGSNFISKEDKQELDDFINELKELDHILKETNKRGSNLWKVKSKGGTAGEVGSLKGMRERLSKYEKDVKDENKKETDRLARLESAREALKAKKEASEQARTKKEIKKSGGNKKNTTTTAAQRKRRKTTTLAQLQSQYAKQEEEESIQEAVEYYEAGVQAAKQTKAIGLSKILRQLGDDRLTDLRYHGGGHGVKPERTVKDEPSTSARRGPYESKFLRQMYQSKKDFYDTYGTKFTYKKFDTNEDFNAYLKAQHEKDEIKGKNKNDLTEKEKAAGISDSVMKKLSTAISAIQKGKPDTTLEDLAKYLEGVQKYNEKAGRSVLDTILGISGMSIAKYFRLENFFDVGYGDNDYRKDQHKNDKDYAIKNDPVVIELVKSIFEGIKKQVSSSDMIDAESLRQRRIAVGLTKTKKNRRGIAPEDDPSNRYKYGKGVSGVSKQLEDFIDSGKLEKITKKAFADVAKVMESVQSETRKAIEPIVKTTSDTKKVTEKQLMNDRIADSDQQMANHAEAKKNQERNDILEKDANSGGNTDEKMNEVISVIKTKNKSSKKDEAKEQLEKDEVKKQTEKSEIEEQPVDTSMKETLQKTLTDIPGTEAGICPCEPILNAILKEAQAIHENIKAVIVYLYREPASKKEKKKQTKEELDRKIEEYTPSPEQQEMKTEEFTDAINELPEFLQKVLREGRARRASENFSPNLPITVGDTVKTVLQDIIDGITSKDILSKQITKETELAIEKNKTVDTPSVLDAKGFNPLVPALKEGEGARNYLDIINAAVKDGLKETEIQPSPSTWDDNIDRLKEEAEIRERNNEQIKQELKLARDRNKNKTKPTTPTTIELGGNVEKISGFKDILKNIFKNVSYKSEAERVANLSASDRAKETAARKEKYGEARGRGTLSDTGLIASTRYIKGLWRGHDEVGKGDALFQNITKTDSISGIDSAKILDGLQELLQNNMFTAQTGGAWRNLLGSMSFYIGMPSLEKSRAEADGLNEVLALVREEILKLVEDIKGNEDILKAMVEEGNAEFNDKGEMIYGTPAARKTFTDLENQKDTLRSALAEADNFNEVVKNAGNNMHTVVKEASFLMPELRKANVILQNLGAGLDKNGKVLKFQTRTAEVLNYSFQLMARYIGQIWKNWMMTLNPISQIKKVFSDFASYDVKWQRTMNVIKYNIRRIIKPFMEWLAQQFVNIIGLANALLKGLGKAFGENWDLFDQSAASAEKMNEELEAAVNVSAGFDELHDIGSDNSAAGDLMGDIYTPQWTDLYTKIENFGKTIGDTLEGIHKLTEGWNFWTWLSVIGGAILGYKLLKWILSLFGKGKNPLQSVADGLSFLEKAVGWAILIWAFTEFTKALKDFIDVVGHMEPDEVKQALLSLAKGFLILVGALAGIMLLERIFKINWLALLGEAGLVAALALLVTSFTNFIETIGNMENADVERALGALGIALGIIALTITALLVVLAAVGPAAAPAIAAFGLMELGLAAIIAAMTLFITAVAEHSEELIAVIRVVGETIKSIITTIGEQIKGILKTIGDFILDLVTTIVTGIALIIDTIGNNIVKIIDAVTTGIIKVLQPIMDFIDKIVDKIVDLAKVIAHEIGETIRTIIKTVGDVILGIIDSIVEAIPKLLRAILDFCRDIGPAIENSIDAIMRSITKLINFVISAVEYMINTLFIDSINGFLSKIPGVGAIIKLEPVSIRRFTPQYEKGTNYVPNDGLAYLHQGEAVIPKKYNTPYSQGMNNEERAYMQRMINTMNSLDAAMKQGIKVNGEFRQRGSDLVAVVNKTNSQTGANLLSNVSYAR